MKKLVTVLLLAAVLALTFLTSSCHTIIIPGGNTGAIVTRDFDIDNFNKIETGNAFKIEVTRSDTYSVKVTAGENIFQYLDISKSGSTLKINLNGVWSFGSLTLEASVTMPDLRGFDVSGAAHGSARGFDSADSMDCELSGASRLELDMKTGDFKCQASGASQLTGLLAAAGTDIKLSGASLANITGSGGNLQLNGSGASTASLINFTVDDVDVTLSGASRAELDINGRLDADLSGASSVKYSGNPTLGNLKTSGGSSISRK